MITVTLLRSLPQCCFSPCVLNSSALGSGSAADIYCTGDRTHSFFLWKSHTQHVKLLSQGQTQTLQEKVYCLLRGAHKTGEAQLPLHAAVSVQCAWAQLSGLISSQMIDLRPSSASLSNWRAVELKTGQITNEIWLTFPWASRLKLSDRMWKEFVNYLVWCQLESDFSPLHKSHFSLWVSPHLGGGMLRVSQRCPSIANGQEMSM